MKAENVWETRLAIAFCIFFILYGLAVWFIHKDFDDGYAIALCAFFGITIIQSKRKERK